MDLFKILSRGTKKSSIQPATTTSSAKPTNPQLYHDPVRGVKRKRNEEALQLEAKNENEDVDFFAAKESDTKSSTTTSSKKPHVAASKTEHAPPQLLDRDEVRQVLHTHRLKYTVLSKHEESKSKVKKSKKKKEAPKKSKDTKQTLYPQPLTSFNELRSKYSVSTRLVENIAKQGYRLPTEVQIGSLPLLLDPKTALDGAADEDLGFATDKDVNFLAVAPTGSGKTLAFLIPAITAILRRRSEEVMHDDHVVQTIVIAPTRELAHQIANEGRKLAAGTGVKIVGFKKGMRLPAEDEDSDAEETFAENGDEEDGPGESDEDDQSDTQASKGPITKADIVVTTPMMLLNFLSKGSKKTLPAVRSIVLDEGDVLLDPLFRDQTLGIWKSCTHPSLRLTCWSATMGSNIESLLIEQLSSRDNQAPLIRIVVGLKDTAVPSIDHHLMYTGDNERGKLYTLRQLLHPQSSDSLVQDLRLPFLVFVQTIERATSLHDELKFEFPVEAGGSTRIACLHSSLSETARSAIIARFRAGEIWVLITTDLLMRGIDFRGVNGVINFDVPTSAAAYVHRVGRTGRAGHEGGIAVTFYTKEDVPYLKNIANVIALSDKQAGKGGDGAVPKWLMDALPKVRKEDKKKLKERGIESRRGNKAQITTKSGWERQKENNRRDAIVGSKKRKVAAGKEESEGEWSGLDN